MLRRRRDGCRIGRATSEAPIRYSSSGRRFERARWSKARHTIRSMSSPERRESCAPVRLTRSVRFLPQDVLPLYAAARITLHQCLDLGDTHTIEVAEDRMLEA